MEVFLKAFFGLFKEPFRYAIAISVVASVALFAPDSIINKMGLLKIREEGKPYFGGLLLLCIVIIIASGIGHVVKKYNSRKFRRVGLKRLQSLTLEEKDILNSYIEGQSRTAYLPINSGVVQGLVTEHIIWRSSSMVTMDMRTSELVCAFNIQPWAWDCLNNDRNLLG